MTAVREQAELGAGVDEVWKLIGDFGGFPEAMGLPVTVSGEGIGMTRNIELGGANVERLEELDNDSKRLVYSLVEGVVKVKDYVSTMQLTAIDEGRTRLDWSGTFEPDGIPEADAIAAIRGIYTGAIGGLQARFGA